MGNCFTKKGVERFGLSFDDAQNKNDWRLKIKEATGLPRFT